jgi:hypothetical protein
MSTQNGNRIGLPVRLSGPKSTTNFPQIKEGSEFGAGFLSPR